MISKLALFLYQIQVAKKLNGEVELPIDITQVFSFKANPPQRQQGQTSEFIPSPIYTTPPSYTHNESARLNETPIPIYQQTTSRNP